MGPGKTEAHPFFRRISVVQMPYLGPPKSCREMGSSRLGRYFMDVRALRLEIKHASTGVNAEGEVCRNMVVESYLSGLLQAHAPRCERL
jgi:hypothetical protein